MTGVAVAEVAKLINIEPKSALRVINLRFSFKVREPTQDRAVEIVRKRYGHHLQSARFIDDWTLSVTSKFHPESFDKLFAFFGRVQKFLEKSDEDAEEE